jgi:hypothetical protein
MTNILAAIQRQEMVGLKQQTTANQEVALQYQILLLAAECMDEIVVSSARECRECLIDKVFDILPPLPRYRRLMG